MFIYFTNVAHSSYIYFHEDTRATRVDMPIYIGSVPTEHLDTFDVKLKESFKRIVAEGIDMERMKMVIDREIRQVCAEDQQDGLLFTYEWLSTSCAANWSRTRVKPSQLVSSMTSFMGRKMALNCTA
jgi:hypothetical protein